MKIRNAFLLILLFSLSQKTFSQNQRLLKAANSFYDSKDYVKALEQYEAALVGYNDDRILLYNTACTASLLGNVEKANDYLRRSIENGYIDLDWLIKDKDFDNLRKTKFWDENINLLKKNFSAIESDFAGVKNIQFKNLIPFKKDGKWGYLNKENLEIVVPPNYFSVGFGGICLKVESTKKNYLNVDKNGKVENYRPRLVNWGYPPHFPPSYSTNHSKNSPRIDSTKNFKGFRVNKNQRITEVSSIYEAKPKPEDTGEELVFVDQDVYDTESANSDVGIFGPYKINGKWYAIAIKNKKYGVIDEEGNELKSLGFKFDYLSIEEKYKGDDVLFFFKDSSQKSGFINSKGEIKFYEDYNFGHEISKDKPHYVELYKDGHFGILDVSNLQWVIEPSQLKYISADFTFENDNCSNIIDRRRRYKKLDYYFLVKDKDGNVFYIGENNERYQVK